MNKDIFSLKNGFFALLFISVGYFLPEMYQSLRFTSKDNNLETDTAISTTQGQYELVLIYIGCSTCGASNVEGLPDSFIKIKEFLNNRADKYGYAFHTIGISKDEKIKDELMHLSKYGNMNEIIVGNDWSNTGILKYIYNDFPGPASIPQIIVAKRKFRAISNYSQTFYRAIEDEAVLMRKIGPDEIKEYAENKAPIPTDAFDLNM